MSKINDGGAAFPGEKNIRFGQDNDVNEGMSLRDWFAGQALAGDMAAQNNDVGHWLNDVNEDHIKDRASFLYRFADAMLAARDKGGAE